MCPPGIDQTGRMPQKWRIVLPNLSQTQSVERTEKEGDTPWSSSNPLAGHTDPLNFGSKLARHGTVFNRCQLEMDLCASKSLFQTSKLISFPTEIIMSILELLDYQDVINLGLSCSVFLHLVLGYIDQDIRRNAGPWADQPLAILGNYLQDLPPPFYDNGLAYKSVNREDLMKMDVDNGQSFIPRKFHYYPARQFYWDTDDKFQHMTNENQPGLASWLDALNKSGSPETCQNNAQRIIVKDALLHADISECCFTKDLCFMESGCYLRNLNDQELVRLCVCDGLDKAHARLQSHASELTEKYMLDDIMLVQTRWSDFGPENWGRMRYFAADPTGPWAGHRFDIVTVKAHDEEVVAEHLPAWKDVTEEVVIKVAWEQDYQTGFRSVAAKQGYSKTAREEWSLYMSQARSKLREAGESSGYAEEILQWSKQLEGPSLPQCLEDHDLLD